MRWATIVAGVFMSTSGVLAAGSAQAAISRYELNIPREPLDTALKDLAQQTGLQVGRFSDAVRGDTLVGPLNGHYSADEALKSLLGPSRLTYRTLNDRAFIVLKPEDLNQSPSATETTQPLTSNQTAPASSEPTPGWDRLRLAQASQGSSTGAPAPDHGSASPASPMLIQEVVVTAQKREERLQDVPIPVTAISGQILADANHFKIADYYSSVPGLNLTPSIQSAQNLSIRGITTGFANPTVGVTIDDVPYGSSLSGSGGLQVPDFDPSDLARVEVLRGPQGTLYGASSMGGLLKFVTLDPSTDGVSGRIQAGTSAVVNGNGLGYSVRGSVNLPLSETVAIRASGFTREDPGYIDNIFTGQKGVNEERADGGRVSLLWRPSDVFSVKLGALYQVSRADGSTDIDKNISGFGGIGGSPAPIMRDLQQYYIPDTGGFDRRLQAYSATIKAKAGIVDLTAITGYTVNAINDSFDYSYALGGTAAFLFPSCGAVCGAPDFNYYNTRKMTQEVRAELPLGDRVQWLLGVYYGHEKSLFNQSVGAQIATTGAVVGSLIAIYNTLTYTEYAAFTDFTVKFTDQFDLQIGGRESHDPQTQGPNGTIGVPPYFGNNTLTYNPEIHSTDNAFTYLVTPRFRISPDFMIYARLASGYRAGGPNAGCTTFGFQCDYGPDKTLNYELGTKGDFLSHALSVDASLYYIDWKDIQVQAQTTTATGAQQTFNTNGSRAKSQGIELSVQAKPVESLRIDGWLAFNDSALTQRFPTGPLYGVSGDRLPLGSRFSGHLAAEQRFPLWATWTGFGGAELDYSGRRLGVFQGVSVTTDLPEPRQEYGGYAKIDLRAGARYESWTLNVFVNNLADRRGELGGGIGLYPPFAFTYITPRTVGFSVDKQF